MQVGYFWYLILYFHLSSFQILSILLARQSLQSSLDSNVLISFSSLLSVEPSKSHTKVNELYCHSEILPVMELLTKAVIIKAAETTHCT